MAQSRTRYHTFNPESGYHPVSLGMPCSACTVPLVCGASRDPISVFWRSHAGKTKKDRTIMDRTRKTRRLVSGGGPAPGELSGDYEAAALV